jgi:hypothetical protein
MGMISRHQKTIKNIDLIFGFRPVRELSPGASCSSASALVSVTAAIVAVKTPAASGISGK